MYTKPPTHYAPNKNPFYYLFHALVLCMSNVILRENVNQIRAPHTKASASNRQFSDPGARKLAEKLDGHPLTLAKQLVAYLRKCHLAKQHKMGEGALDGTHSFMPFCGF